MEDEKPVFIPHSDHGWLLPDHTVDCLSWLIPMAFAKSPVYARVSEIAIDPEP